MHGHPGPKAGEAQGWNLGVPLPCGGEGEREVKFTGHGVLEPVFYPFVRLQLVCSVFFNIFQVPKLK